MRLARFLLPAVMTSALIGFGVYSQSEESPQAMKTYDWTSTESAPADFPMQILRADLALADGGTYYVPDDRTAHNEWGAVGATHLVGDDLKALPKVLNAQWYSYIEDTFYGGEFELPTEAIQAFFDEGLDSPHRGERRAFDKVIFGFGPEGEGAVWLSGHSTVVQVMRFQAPKIELDWSVVLDDPDVPRETFVEVILNETLGDRQEEIAARLPLDGYWPRRQQRFAYSVEVNGAAELDLLRLETLNGERLHFDADGPLVPRSKLGILRRIAIEWVGHGGELRLAEISVPEEEALTAFEKLGAGDGSLKLVIQIAASSNGLAVLLQNDELEYEFSADGIQVYSR